MPGKPHPGVTVRPPGLSSQAPAYVPATIRPPWHLSSCLRLAVITSGTSRLEFATFAHPQCLPSLGEQHRNTHGRWVMGAPVTWPGSTLDGLVV